MFSLLAMAPAHPFTYVLTPKRDDRAAIVKLRRRDASRAITKRALEFPPP
jgi:hypothetical protein